jgi:membrane-bound lytic murein transglycosylase B
VVPTLLLALAARADDWDDVAATAGLSAAECKTLVEAAATRQQTVLDRMATPWEAKPWSAYAPLFLTAERVDGGVAFWSANADVLARVAGATGVPAEYVVAILGVETRYGARMGDDRVIDALYTLGFYHPTRGRFFRGELGEFVRLATDEGWPLAEPEGSYAGAMGLGQFMPSSYRAYAVDGDADGHRDLFHDPADAIASVASYFVAHGWKPGEPVLVEAPDPRPEGVAGTVYAFDVEGGVEYRVGLANFETIQQYNHSPLYARAVVELAARIRAAHDAATP